MPIQIDRRDRPAKRRGPVIETTIRVALHRQESVDALAHHLGRAIDARALRSWVDRLINATLDGLGAEYDEHKAEETRRAVVANVTPITGARDPVQHARAWMNRRGR